MDITVMKNMNVSVKSRFLVNDKKKIKQAVAV